MSAGLPPRVARRPRGPPPPPPRAGSPGEGGGGRPPPPDKSPPAMSHDRSIFPSRDADTDREHHTASPTAHLLDELALYGHRFRQDEPDPRPLPEPDPIQSQLDAMVEGFAPMLTRTRLADDLAALL